MRNALPSNAPGALRILAHRKRGIRPVCGIANPSGSASLFFSWQGVLVKPVRKGISHPLNLLLISMQPRWRGRPESALHPSASPSEAALAKKRGAKRAKGSATKAVPLRPGRRARMMQMADARRKRKRCRIRPFTLYGQTLSGFPALTGYERSSRLEQAGCLHGAPCWLAAASALRAHHVQMAQVSA